jgi:hypothetical protein
MVYYSCPEGYVGLTPGGGMLCYSQEGIPVPWTVGDSASGAWSLNDLDPALVAQAFSWGFGAVVTSWLMGRVIGLVLQAIKQW